MTIRPSTDLGMIAGELIQGRRGDLRLSPFLRAFMRTFGSGADPKEADLLSYLLFDTNYARPLADLGYRDALAQEEQLAAFFSEDDPS